MYIRAAFFCGGGGGVDEIFLLLLTVARSERKRKISLKTKLPTRYVSFREDSREPLKTSKFFAFSIPCFAATQKSVYPTRTKHRSTVPSRPFVSSSHQTQFTAS